MEESIRDFKWLFPEDKLRNTPSVRMGISPEKELTFRQKEAMLIQAIGSRAHLTQLAVKTSVVFMHRFFMYRSVTYYPRVQLAIAFALAGGKVEESESARKLEHLIRSAVEVLCANKNREFLDKSDMFTYEMDSKLKPKIAALKESKCNTDTAEYLEMRKLILECETEIYSVIGFQLQIVHPHNFVLRMCSLLGADVIKDITQYAYNLATASSQLTMLCLKYKPETIATMCLNVAFKANGVQLTSLKDSKIKWYHVYDASTDFDVIEAVSKEFLQLLKGCPLLPTWMGLLARISKRGVPGPVRGPGGYPPSRQQGKVGGSGTSTSSQNHTVPAQNASRHPGSSSQSGGTDSSQHRSSVSSQGDAPVGLSTGARPSHPSSSFKPQGSRHSALSSSSASQQQLEPQASSSSSGTWPPQAPPASVSSSSTSFRLPQDSSRHMARSSEDPPRLREDQPYKTDSSRLEHNPDQAKFKHHQAQRHRDGGSGRQPQQLFNAHSRPSDAVSSHLTQEEEAQSPSSQGPANDSPVAVRPPSPPFPPPVDMEVDEDLSESKLSPPDLSDNNSSSVPLAAAAGSKLSLSDYRQRATARRKEAASSSLSQGGDSSQDEINISKLSEGTTDGEASSEPASKSSIEEKLPVFSFTKPQDSPSNPPIKIKVKRDPSFGERHHTVKYADSGLNLKIKIKPPKPEGESSEEPQLEDPSGYSTPREEGEILDSTPSPASYTESGRKSEGIRIRLSLPKTSESGGSNRRESDHWSNGRESGHRSHHHGHHSHRSHHKSKKHKEHRSNRHEQKFSSTPGATSSKRSGSSSYEDRQPKSSRMTDAGETYTSSGMGIPPPPPPPPPHPYTLQHQNSGFSINDAFSSALPLGPDNIPEIVEEQHLPVPTTPGMEGIPPHHERFHRMLEQHRARVEAKRPPLPPVPPPPPPPSSPPPPPPASL